MSGLSWPLQQAVFAHLAADTALQALIGNPARLYDAPPVEPERPFVTLGDDSVVDWSAVGVAGFDVTLNLHAWCDTHRGRMAVKQILDVLHERMHNAALTVAGAHVVLCQFQSSSTEQTEDGLFYHGSIAFRVLLHQS